MVAYHTPKGIDNATYPMDVVGTALGDSSRKSTRLYKSLIESGLCSECSASNYTLLDPGLFMVQATVQPGKNPKEVEAVILAEINRVIAEKLTESEIARSKVNIIKHFKLSLSDPMGMAQSLTEGIAVGSWKWWANYPREIEKVDAKSCQTESAKIFTENNRTVGYYLPSEHTLGEYEDYKVAQVKLPPVAQEELPATVKMAEDKPTTTASATRALAPQIRRITLNNGLTVLLLPATEGNGTVAVSAKIRAGEYFAPAQSRMVADILAKLISYGTKTLNKQTLASKLEFTGTSLEMDGGNFFHEFDTEVVKEDLPELIGIIKSCLTEPLLSDADFEEVKQLSIAQIKEESTQTEIDYSTAPKEETEKAAPVTNNHIVIKAGDNMRFDKTEFTVKAGEEVTLILMNTGEMSKEAMGHNFILLKPGSDASSFANTAASAKESDYFPTDLQAQVIAHTKLLGGRENDQIKFTLEAGTFDFLCSFPGHFATMNGKITAVK